MNKSNAGANTNTIQILSDILVQIIACVTAYCLVGRNIQGKELVSILVLHAVFTLIYILGNKEQYLYNVTLFYYLDRVFRKIVKSFLLAFVSTTAIMNFMVISQEGKMWYYYFLAISFIIVCLKVMLVRPYMNRFAEKSAPRTVYVGKVEHFNKFNYFLDKTSININCIGYIAMSRESMEGAPQGTYLGCLEDFEELIHEHYIDQVYIIQKRDMELPFTQKYVDLCIDMGVTVRLIVDFYKRRRANSYVSTVGTYPVITYHTVSLNTYEQVVKRLVDILGGFVGCVLFAPIMLVTAIAIKIDSPGPVFFKQVRVGQNGRHFKIYKFRSMYIDAEERKKELMAQNEIDGGIMFKMKDDPRITRVGKFIRKFSIDELPQFFNVLLGSMSLVGTRPPTVDEVEKYARKHWRRISIKPGLTGMWQVSGRSNITDFEEIVEMDVEYIDNWSLFMDIRLIFKTVWVVLKHEDAY